MPDIKYVELDGAWHILGDNEHTDCGLLVPPLAEWTRETPAKLHDPADDAKPKAKAKK